MISKTFADFFKRTGDERHVFLQGGRRSGKTFATFQYLRAYAGLIGGCKVLVVCASYPQLQKTMEDFQGATGVMVSGSIVGGYHATTEGGTVWQFAHFDHPTKAQGTQCDFLFINECVNVERAVAEVLMQSARLQCFYNYNPTKKFWGSDFQNTNNVMTTTFKDNAYLTPAQAAEFEALKERAQRPTATRHDEYMYRVYYCGEFSDMAGAVFGSVERVTTDHYKEIPATEVYGVDFGFALDGDPTTMIGCKVWQKCAYFHEYIYERGLTNDEELARRMVAAGVDRHSLIFGDYGGAGKGRMYTLITADNGKWEGDIACGIPMQNAVKGTILDGLSQMLSMDAIYVTDTSTNLRDEMEGYELDDGGKPHGADHAIDAARYALTYAKNYL